MTDPFGAIAMQRPGDLGVHIGQGSWMGSSQGIPVAITVSSPGASDSFGFVSGSQWNFIAGSIAKPVNAAQSMVKMIYTQKITSSPNVFDAQYGAALFVNLNSLSGNVQQATGTFSRAYGYSTGVNFVLGAEIKGEQISGTGGALGASILGLSQSASANAIIGTSVGISNQTGNDYPYDPALAGNVAFGLEVVMDATAAKRHGAGVLIRSASNNGVMDVGYALPNAAVINIAGFRDDSLTSPISFHSPGDHGTSNVVLGTGDHLGVFTPGVGRRMDILHGSTVSPVVSGSPAVLISRTDALTAPPSTGSNAALEVAQYSIANTRVNTQTKALVANAKGAWSGSGTNNDLIGVDASAVALNGAVLAAWGIAAAAKLETTGSIMTAIEAAIENGSGLSILYNATGKGQSEGINVTATNYGGGPTVLNGVGIKVGNNQNDGIFDVGVAISALGASSAGFRDDSSSNIGLAITGSHSTAGIHIINNNGQYMARWERTSATTGSYGTAVLGVDGSWVLDEVGVATKFKITKGTPGANTTAVYIQEGAGPTLRRLTTFDPGNLGINFTAGQLVCVLV